MDFNMIQALDSTTSVSGTPGLFLPKDQAKLERLWHKVLELSALTTDLSAVLTRVELLEEATGDLTDIRSTIDQIRSNVGEMRDELNDNDTRFAAIETNQLTFEESLGTMADEQLEYVRNIGFDSSSGALHFFDGYGADVFTLGGATYETIADDGDSDGGE